VRSCRKPVAWIPTADVDSGVVATLQTFQSPSKDCKPRPMTDPNAQPWTKSQTTLRVGTSLTVVWRRTSESSTLISRIGSWRPLTVGSPNSRIWLEVVSGAGEQPEGQISPHSLPIYKCDRW
jgi:hypothetical protein